MSLPTLPSAPTMPPMPAPSPAGALAAGSKALAAAGQKAPAPPQLPTPGGGSKTPATNPANEMRFDVKIDSITLGSFTKFEGLSFSYDVKTYEEGGENGYVHQLPGRLKYENLKVSRAVDSGSAAIASWFASLASGGAFSRSNATVTAYNDNSQPVASWTFTGVYPVRYSGPGFSADGSKVAIETLELAHSGLLS